MDYAYSKLKLFYNIGRVIFQEMMNVEMIKSKGLRICSERLNCSPATCGAA
jgi:hypothetical protein